MKKIKMNEVVELMKQVGLNKVEVNGLFLEIKENGLTSTNALIEGFESLYDSVYNLVCETEIKENDLTPTSERYFSETVNHFTIVEEKSLHSDRQLITIKYLAETIFYKGFDKNEVLDVDTITSQALRDLCKVLGVESVPARLYKELLTCVNSLIAETTDLVVPSDLIEKIDNECKFAKYELNEIRKSIMALKSYYKTNNICILEFDNYYLIDINDNVSNELEQDVLNNIGMEFL